MPPHCIASLLHTALSQNNKCHLNVLYILHSSLIIGSFGNFGINMEHLETFPSLHDS